MTPNRYQRAYDSLTATARKIFDVVPVQTPWSSFQIGNELKRIGTPKDRVVIDGCLSSLLKDGLIVENDKREFIRAPVRVTPASPPEEPVMPESPIDNLGKLSASLRALAEQLDVIALQVAEELEKQKKFDQLRSLLKEIV